MICFYHSADWRCKRDFSEWQRAGGERRKVAILRFSMETCAGRTAAYNCAHSSAGPPIVIKIKLGATGVFGLNALRKPFCCRRLHRQRLPKVCWQQPEAAPKRENRI